MSTSNIKSTALETEVTMKLGLGNMVTQVLMRYGLLILTVLLIILFSDN